MLKAKNSFCLLIVLIFTLTVSCKKDEPQEKVFVKEIPTKEDPILLWLGDIKNYGNKKNYLAVFYKHYNEKLAKKNYIQATQLINIVATKLVYFYDFDTNFQVTIKEFDAKYRKKVPALKTTFVDTYYANYLFDQGLFQKSCDYFKKITVLEPNDYDSCKNIARAYYELSYTYLLMGRQNLSLQANHKALLYYNKINYLVGIGSVYSNYTEIYKATKNNKKAIESINKAIQCYVKATNTYDTYMGLFNKMCLYSETFNPNASALIDSSYTVFTKSKFDSDVLKIAFSYHRIQNLIKQNQLLEAKMLLDTLKPIVKKVNSNTWTQFYETASAEYEIENNPKNVNLSNILKVIPSLHENKQFVKLVLFYTVLKKNAVKKNDYKSALFYQEKLNAVTDSIGSNSMQTKVLDLEAKYQTQKKEQQIATQKKDIAYKNATIAWLAFLLLLAFIIVVIYQNNQKQKRLEFEKQNVQLYTKQLLEKTEEERKRIASDLHDSVSHELLGLKNTTSEKLDQTNKKIDAIINDIRSISRNLHPIMFDKIGLKASVEQLTERAQAVNDFMVTSEIDYNGSLATTDELQLYRIIQEALSNVIKYADAMAAKITILDNNNALYVEIKDNGKGFNVKEILNGSKSFGLHNIIERSKAIGGKAKITSNKIGTTIAIQIKKA